MVEVAHYNNNDNNLCFCKVHFSILTDPQIASASLGGPVHQDQRNVIISRLTN